MTKIGGKRGGRARGGVLVGETTISCGGLISLQAGEKKAPKKCIGKPVKVSSVQVSNLVWHNWKERFLRRIFK